MTYTRNSPIAKSSDVTAEELIYAFSAITPPDQMENMKRAVRESVKMSKETGVDPVVVNAIGWVETGYGDQGLPFRHPNWKNEFNFGNLGKTGDKSQNAASQKWPTPEGGVIATVAHLVAYRWDRNYRTAWDIAKLGDPSIPDKRFLLAVNNTPSGDGVKTIGELNNRWAVDRDNDYGGKLAERANKLQASIDKYRREEDTIPEVPNMPTRDPYDLIRDYVVDAWVRKDREGQGYNSGNRNIVGLRQHETQGIMTGFARRDFFSCPNGERCEDALVDYGIPRNEKKIYVFQNPFTSNRIPHASGGLASAITQTARLATARMGNPYGGVNAIFAAVENELNHGQSMNSDQIEMNARLLAYIWAMNGYSPDDAIYPDSLDNQVQTSGNHDDLYTSTNCHINDASREAFTEMAIDLLRDFYAGTDPAPPPVKPQYAPAAIVPALVPYMTADPNTVPAVVIAEGSEWIFVNDRVTVVKDTPRLQRAGTGALRVGKDLNKGEKFTAKFLVNTGSEGYYYLTAMFTRVQMKHTARLSDKV